MLNSLNSAANGPEARKIQPDEAHAASEAGRAVLLDVRDARLFDNAHLDRAIALPLAEIVAAGGRIPARIPVPEDALLILYCA
jgi:rhodanese-related sulfurtransferase